MKKVVLAAMILTTSLWAAAPVQAWGLRHHRGCKESCCPAPCAPACATPCATTTVQWVEKELTCYRSEMRTRPVVETVTRMVPQTITEQRQITVCVPVTVPKKEIITEYTRVPRVITKQVCCCERVPVCVTDPCTCCTRTCWQTRQVVKNVSCTVYECVPHQREITVQVCSYQQQVKTVPVTRVVCHPVQEQVTRNVCYCVQVPVVTKVRVPVCVPCPPAPCAPCGGCS